MRTVLLSVLAAIAGAGAPATARADSPPRERRRSAVVEVFEQCRDAVVNVATTRIVQRRRDLFDEIFEFGRPLAQQISSVGSGVIIHERGYVVTNAHVVARTSDIHITFADGRTVAAELLADDAEHDLAVLRIRSDRPLPAITLGRSDDLMIGETVIAVGNPLGLQHTVTAGIISALGRELNFSPRTVYRGLIQTDAAINPGNSGGPLLNVNGELIGITTAIRGDAQNVGFAIPVDQLWELLPNLLDLERRERVKLGMRVSGAAAEVLSVAPDGAASRAGIAPGDRIVGFDGDPIRNGIDYYVRLLELNPPATIRLALQRDGAALTRDLPVELLPPPDGRALASRMLGIEVAEMTATSRRRTGLPDWKGLVIERVASGGPGARVGLRPGDMILQVGRHPVSSLRVLGQLLELFRPGETVRLFIARVEGDELVAGTCEVEVPRERRP